MHKCEACPMTGEYQGMGFRPVDICTKAGNLVDAVKAYNAPECPYKVKTVLERAVEDIRMLGRTGEFICPVCAYFNHGEGTKGECVKCLTGDGFRWRGEKDDGGAS